MRRMFVPAMLAVTLMGAMHCVGGDWLYEVTETKDGVVWTANVYDDDRGGKSVDLIGAVGAAGDVVIPETVAGLKVTSCDFAFQNNDSITSVTYPTGVEDARQDAFEGCTNLRAYYVAPGNKRLASVGGLLYFKSSGDDEDDDDEDDEDDYDYYIVGVPTGLKTLELPVRTGLDPIAVQCCDILSSITVAPGHEFNTSIDGVLFSKDGKTLVRCPPGRTGTYAVPDGTETIGWGAFMYCGKLSGVTIPDSVKTVEDAAFRDCSCVDYDQIANIGIVDGWAVESDNYELSGALDLSRLRGIASGTFRDAAGLTSVRLPDGMRMIGSVTFEGCSSLASVNIPDSVESIGIAAFGNCADALYDTQTVKGVKLVDGWAVGTTSAMPASLNLAGVRGIAGAAVADCEKLPTSVTIPASVKYIGESAFDCCFKLKSVSLAEGILTIGDYAFFDTALTEVTIPSTVTSLGRDVFSHCSKLKTVRLPESLRGKVDEKRLIIYSRSAKIEYYSGDSSVTPGGSSGGGATATIPDEWKKSRTLNGAVTAADGGVAGVLALKCGKANARKKTAKVSATLTGLDGKKKTYKAQTVSAGESVTVEWDGLTVTIDGNAFSGDAPNGATVASAEVGGAWTANGAKVCVALADGALPGGTRDELLPTEANGGEPVVPRGGKWAFAKAAQVKWAKDRATGAFGLTVNTAGGRTNTSALKLTYAPKTGLFKGSFKVYAVVDNRLKKYTAKVTGLVVDGKGQGTATMTKPVAATWTVEVE